MNNTTTIKTIDPQKRKHIVKIVFYVVLCVIVGVIIAIFGNGTSLIEGSFITCLLTLFGFDLTSVVFIYGVLGKYIDSESTKTSKLLKKIVQSLKLILLLIIVAIIMDFVVSLLCQNNALAIIIRSIKYALLAYSLICQIDVINAFLILIKELPRNEKND